MNKFLTSRLVTQSEFSEPCYNTWCTQIKEPPVTHRKQAEFVMICEALQRMKMLQHGKHGVGFAVGDEPLPALFASLGCKVLATDLDLDDERTSKWMATNQTCTIDSLNNRGICEPTEFTERVKYRAVDMNRIPSDIGLCDFLWSACAVEHLGSIELGSNFIVNTLDIIKENGVSVNTLEYNVSSNWNTVEKGETVLFRQQDILNIIKRAKAKGFETVGTPSFDIGDGKLDRYVDLPPYRRSPHIKLEIDKYVCTSFILILKKVS